MVVVEFGNVAAARRREVCIDIVNGLTPDDVGGYVDSKKKRPRSVYRVGAMGLAEVAEDRGEMS
jgi:hypothetical protein